ncbi:cation transporter [Carnimonas bestiolae]|uniref:cation transporter n=1 Tax=Carnimonas bestiolae TaxID=3402172 RepID=UPI003EDBA1C7
MATTLTLEGLASVADVNKVTAALIEQDGVDNVEVAREWAQVEGQARRDVLVKAVHKAGFKAK